MQQILETYDNCIMLFVIRYFVVASSQSLCWGWKFEGFQMKHLFFLVYPSFALWLELQKYFPQWLCKQHVLSFLIYTNNCRLLMVCSTTYFLYILFLSYFFRIGFKNIVSFYKLDSYKYTRTKNVFKHASCKLASMITKNNIEHNTKA